jgi:phage terminase large subunit-like protein
VKPNDPVTAYARDIIEGRIVACKWIRLACERHMRDLADGRFVWDLREAVKRIEFFPTLRHYKGEFKGKAFILEPWQKFIVGSIFGWKLKANGLRRYRSAFVKVPRKNGKTFLAAGVALQMLMFGGQLQLDGKFSAESGAEVYFVATKEDQAKIGWGDCRKIVKRSPGYAERLTTKQKEIIYERADGTCKYLGSDSDTLDGLNPSCAIKDEFHAWPSRDLHDVIEDAFGARAQPLDFIITTEGTLRHGIHDEIDAHARSVLEGKSSYADESFFAAIYQIDEDDDPFDERSWFKANPNLGVSKSLDYMRDQAAKARLMPGKLSTFLTKQLDRRTDVNERWLSIDMWDGCASVIDSEKLKGRQCFAGMDLARSKDMSALALVFPDDAGNYDVLMRYWLPEDEMKARIERDRVPYDLWAREGLITVTDGNVTDFGQIETEIGTLAQSFPIQEFAYDPMFATDLAMRLKDAHGINAVDFVQTFKNYAMPCKELERLLISSHLRHDGHKVLRWNASNVVVRTGPSGNQMPDKAKSSQRIDGISALLMALGRAVLKEAPAAGPGIFFG